MPFIIPFSVKAAITLGALAGGSIAVMNNKAKLFEYGEVLFQRGADYCRQQAIGCTVNMEEGESEYEEKERGYEPEDDDSETCLSSGVSLSDLKDVDIREVDLPDSEIDLNFETDELTTPSMTDNEWEHDLDMGMELELD